MPSSIESMIRRLILFDSFEIFATACLASAAMVAAASSSEPESSLELHSLLSSWGGYSGQAFLGDSSLASLKLKKELATEQLAAGVSFPHFLISLASLYCRLCVLISLRVGLDRTKSALNWCSGRMLAMARSRKTTRWMRKEMSSWSSIPSLHLLNLSTFGQLGPFPKRVRRSLIPVLMQQRKLKEAAGTASPGSRRKVLEAISRMRDWAEQVPTKKKRTRMMLTSPPMQEKKSSTLLKLREQTGKVAAFVQLICAQTSFTTGTAFVLNCSGIARQCSVITSDPGSRLMSVSTTYWESSPEPTSACVVEKQKQFLSSTQVCTQVCSPGLMRVLTMGKPRVKYPIWLSMAEMRASGAHLESTACWHFSILMVNMLQRSEVTRPPRVNCELRGGQSAMVMGNLLKKAVMSSLMAKCARVHCSRGTAVELIKVKSGPQLYCVREMLKYFRLGSLRSNPTSATAKLKPPSGPATTCTKEGSASLSWLTEALMSSLWTVLMP